MTTQAQHKFRINKGESEYEIHSLDSNEEDGFFIAADNYYEGHEAGSAYHDLGHISEEEAVSRFEQHKEETI